MAAQEMNLRETVECIKFSVEASKQGIKVPLILWGQHGIGKTQTVFQFAEENNYNVVVLHLATQDLADLIGIPREVNKQTVWTEPEWLYKAKEQYEKTGKPNIFFLDEINRGPRMVLAAMLPFLIEGKLHTHTIGINDAVIAAANPACDGGEYDVQDMADEALIDRLGHIIYRPTSKEYIDYMIKQGHSKTTINLLKKNPSWSKIKQFTLPFEVIPSRRSIDYVLSHVEKKDPAWITTYGPNVIEAYLGTSFMEEWMYEYTNTQEGITLDMIMEYENNEDEITAALTTEIDGVVTTRLDILQKANDMIKNWMQENSKEFNSSSLNWIIKFLNNPMVPDDAAASVLMANKLVKEKILTDIDFNKDIMAFLKEKNIITEESVPTW